MQLYINLMRLNKPVGIWLLLLPCWIGLMLFSDELPWREITLFAIGAVAMRSAGCIINDIADRHIDAQVERTKMRPLACGEISIKQAIIMLNMLLLVAFGVATMLGWRVVALGACWLPLVAAYPLMKRITWWPQAFLGVTFGAGGLFASVALNGTITNAALLFYLGCAFWVIGYDTIYACQDMADDTKIGVKSTALLFGDNAKNSVSICYVIAFALFYQSFTISNIGIIGFCGLFASVGILTYQIVELNPKNPKNCCSLFKSNVWFGAIIVVGLLLEKLAH